MSQQRWTAVDDYITDLFGAGDPVLEATLQASAAAGLPAISVSPAQGKFLQLLVRSQGCRSVLEVGTLGGYSTIWLARGLPAVGRVLTLEIDPTHAEVARSNIGRAGLGDVVEVRLGPATDTMAALVEEGHDPFDLVFIDADKPAYPEYLEWALRLSRQGTVIIADNVVRDGAVVDTMSSDPNVRGVRRFNELLAVEARASAIAVQTVGAKGYDGFAFALVTGPL